MRVYCLAISYWMPVTEVEIERFYFSTPEKAQEAWERLSPTYASCGAEYAVETIEVQ